MHNPRKNLPDYTKIPDRKTSYLHERPELSAHRIFLIKSVSIRDTVGQRADFFLSAI
jgi:hypothetical protein